MLRTSLPIVLLVAACEAPEEEWAVEPVSLEGWSSETIELPPEFAPGMPRGKEVLLFAPGMFDAEAEDYWSYVFLMRVERGGIDTDQLTALFEEYYDGLISSVAMSRGLDLPDDPAACRFERMRNGEYEGRVSLIDAFVTGEPVELDVVVRMIDLQSGRSVLRVLVSPQPRDHEIWNALEHALRTLEL